jgi:ribonuclease D
MRSNRPTPGAAENAGRKPIELCVLQHVAAWREREAKPRNVPRGRILKDDALYESRPAAAQGCRGAVAAQDDSARLGTSASGATLIEIVNEALGNTRKEDMPRLPRPKQAPEGAQACYRAAAGAAQADSGKGKRRRQDHRHRR